MPSKRILLLVLLSVSFIGFFVVLKNYQSGGGVVKNVETVPLPTIDEKDADQDGLKDWEELLLGTDPSKTDTDGDGVSDKKEADDKTVGQNGESLLSQVKSSTNKEDLTQTDQITRNMFYDFLVSKSRDGVNSGYIDDLAKRTKSEIFAIKNTPTLYKIENLKIVSGATTDENALQYANDLVIAQKMYPVKGNELSFPGMTSAEDPAFATWAIKMSAYYEKITMAFLRIPVPTELADLHIIVVNALSKMNQEFKILSIGSKDPMSALGTLPIIQASQKELTSTLGGIENYLESRGIIFSSETGLYILKPK